MEQVVTLPWSNKAEFRRLRDRWINKRLAVTAVAAAAASICRDRECTIRLPLQNH